MPSSDPRYNTEIRNWITYNYPSRKIRILDVGPGMGKWRSILNEYKNVDAVEIWKPYINKFALKEKYWHVYNMDIMDFYIFHHYDLIIIGDVLEHLRVADAQSLIERIKMQNKKCSVIVCVPYLYKQDALNDNPYEVHHQDDLTHDVFMERYPDFEVLIRDSQYGVYILKPRSCDNKQKDQKRHKRSDLLVNRDTFKHVYIAIATPTTKGLVTTTFLGSLWNTQVEFHKFGIKSVFMYSDGARVERSRNQLVARFMQYPKATHLLFIDDDIGWHPRAVLRLLAYNKEVIGVAYRKKSSDICSWAINLPEGDILVENGLLKANGLGTGFLMIKRSAIEKMIAAYPELKISKDISGKVMDCSHEHGLFYPEIVDGNDWSEDLNFCNRWRKIGGEIWVDPESDLVHVGLYEYRGALSSALVDS